MNGSAPLDILAPAKINLFLAVTGRRPDGYHELVSLMCPLRLCDRMRIRFGGEEIRVFCDHPDVPSDGRNLAAKAAAAFQEALGVMGGTPFGGLDIHIEKTIPVGAGLGGGSSNAAAVLMALQRAAGRRLPEERLQRIALALGADVPFFLVGGPALAEGVGERLTPYAGLEPMEVVVVYPGFGISTAAVYGRLKLTLTKCQKKLRRLLLNDERFCPRTHLCNDLETAALADFPDIGGIKALLCALGADGALMSGSGSAVFGLFRDPEAAGQARRHFADSHPEWQVFHTSLVVSP